MARCIGICVRQFSPRVLFEVTAGMFIVVSIVHLTFKHRHNLTKEQLSILLNPPAPTSHQSNIRTSNPKQKSALEETHLATVICSNRQEQGIVLIKSAIVMARKKLNLHLFLDKKRVAPIEAFLHKMQKVYPHRFTYRIYDTRYPSIVKQADWYNIYGPCATIRLFFPILLHRLERVIYVDSDVLFLRPPEHLLDQFNNFGSEQMLGISYDHKVHDDGYRSSSKRIPNFTPGRLQSAVLLMHLGRMRTFGWVKNVVKFYNDWRLKDTGASSLFDQAYINLALYFNPEKAYILDCEWDYRPYHWKNDTHHCPNAESGGVSVMHGIQYTFNRKDYNPFTAFYWAFRKHNPGKDSPKSILAEVRRNMKRVIKDDPLKQTAKQHDFFFKQFKKYI